ncbi:TPA: phage terminase small subunit [Acinetobacter baumannii]|uniref:phage terminase small subunit n=1 Tax=Acinetobacter baumannii TaxID=470 RepID=UPI0027C9B52E|nr:phage terminase small subunit [Acinetobacter baumannii]MDQ2391355.1 phage terminase small subunit [Acinetobacter baumannii]
MLSPARRHRLQALAAKAAAYAENEFGGVREDASVYMLQLAELKNDQNLLRNVKSEIERAQYKATLIPKYMPYVEGVLSIEERAPDLKDDVVTTIMLWCFDADMFEDGLRIAEFALKYGLDMPDTFNRDTASIVAEEIGNAAKAAHTEGEVFDIAILEKANTLTSTFSMHDQIRAKLYVAMGRTYLQKELYALAVTFLKRAIKHNENCGGKQELQKAERLLKKQLEENPSQPLLNADGTPVVDDYGNQVFEEVSS